MATRRVMVGDQEVEIPEFNFKLINQYFGGSITENNSDSHVGTKHHLDIVDKKLEKANKKD